MNLHPSWSPRNRWPEVRTLRAEVAELEAIEDYLGVDWDSDDDGTHEIAILREFVRDVRLGIRDLDEYEAICGPAYR